MATIPETYRDLFTKKAFAHLATVGANNAPQVTPVWCDWDGTYVRINTARGRVKEKNLRKNRKWPPRSQTRTNPSRTTRSGEPVAEMRDQAPTPPSHPPARRTPAKHRTPTPSPAEA